MLDTHNEIDFSTRLSSHLHIRIVSRDRPTEYSAAIKTSWCETIEASDSLYHLKNKSIYIYCCPAKMCNHHKYGNSGLDKPHYMVKHHTETRCVIKILPDTKSSKKNLSGAGGFADDTFGFTPVDRYGQRVFKFYDSETVTLVFGR